MISLLFAEAIKDCRPRADVVVGGGKHINSILPVSGAGAGSFLPELIDCFSRERERRDGSKPYFEFPSGGTKVAPIGGGIRAREEHFQLAK